VVTESAELRLSAVRAFLGRVHGSFRLIKVGIHGAQIVVTVVLDQAPMPRTSSDIAEAATEVAADFPQYSVREVVIVSTSALPHEDVIHTGWIYARAEPPA
jgi:hypothetical protein